MDSHTLKLKLRLGLFIAGGVVLLLLALFLLGKQKNLFSPVFKLTTNFKNVSGLEVGSNIRFAGITVGTVDYIKIINDSTVQVDMMVNKSVQQFIKEDCLATIGSEGIIGDRILVITQGGFDSALAKEGQHIGSKEPVETDAIMASLQKTAGSVEVITDQLAVVMTKINNGQGTLGRLINDNTIAQDLSESTANLKNSSKQISEILTDINNGHGTIGKIMKDSTIANDLSLTMENLKNSTKGLDEILEAAKHNFLFRGYFRNKDNESENNNDQEEKTQRNNQTKKNETQKPRESNLENQIQQITGASPVEMDTLMANLQVTIANSKIISKQLVSIVTMINSGQGTIGMLVQDTIMASAINQTLMNLKSSSKGLDENMKAVRENFFFKGYYERKQKADAEKIKKNNNTNK